MKKIFFALLTLFLLPAASPALMFQKTTGGLELGISPNAELLYTLLQLAPSSDGLRKAAPKPDVTRLFARYKDHPAVAELAAGGKLNWRKGFCYDMLPEYSLYFSDLPEGRRLRAYDGEFLARVLDGMTTDEKIKYLDGYWEKARDFYTAADFAGYLAANAGVYGGYVAAVSSALPPFDVIQLQQDYHGASGMKFHVVPSPLSLPSGGNYGPRVGSDVYNFIGSSFGSPDNVKALALHEFGHPFCNPVVEKFETALSSYAFLNKGVESEMRRMAYGDWLTVMRELLVRSVHARLTLKTEGREAAERMLAEERGNKFVFIDDFYALLDTYEKNREKYPTLHEFYPVLAATLANWELAEVTEPEEMGFRTWTREKGVQIYSVDKDKAGYAAGFRENDMVTKIDGAELKGAFFRALEAGKAYTLTVRHADGSTAGLSFTVKAVKVLRPVRKTAKPGPLSPL